MVALDLILWGIEPPEAPGDHLPAQPGNLMALRRLILRTWSDNALPSLDQLRELRLERPREWYRDPCPERGQLANLQVLDLDHNELTACQAGGLASAGDPCRSLHP